MLKRPGNRQPAETARVEDVISADLLADDMVDRDYLAQVLQDPQRYLPTPTEPVPQPASSSVESPIARRAKLVALALATVLLACSVVAAAKLSERTHNQAPASDLNAPTITGVAALGGFAAPEHPSPPDPSLAPAAPSSTAAPSATTSGVPAHQSKIAAPTKAAAGKPGTARSVTDEDKIGAIKSFYGNIGQNPQNALALLDLSILDPALGLPGASDLVQAWNAISGIYLHQVAPQADGTVRTVLIMQKSDGHRVRITQLLKLTDTLPAKIISARLLSAERV